MIIVVSVWNQYSTRFKQIQHVFYIWQQRSKLDCCRSVGGFTWTVMYVRLQYPLKTNDNFVLRTVFKLQILWIVISLDIRHTRRWQRHMFLHVTFRCGTWLHKSSFYVLYVWWLLLFLSEINTAHVLNKSNKIWCWSPTVNKLQTILTNITFP
jgi:hypothetical protein